MMIEGCQIEAGNMQLGKGAEQGKKNLQPLLWCRTVANIKAVAKLAHKCKGKKLH